MPRLILGRPASGSKISGLATDAHKTFIYIVLFLLFLATSRKNILCGGH